jgi:DNA-binding NarL/FixJ family response regulator
MSNTKIPIAVVDDHVMFRKGLCMLIELFKQYEVVVEANNGLDLQAFMQQNTIKPEIVLLDINMPKKDGYETALWLQQNFPNCKVLALSTMDTEASIIKMIGNGARGYILKDANPDELRQALQDVQTGGYYYNQLVNKDSIKKWQAQDGNNGKSVQDLFNITDKEYAFLQLACSEKNYQQIAKEMFLSERTIDGYRESLFKKLGVATRVGLVIFAMKNKLV